MQHPMAISAHCNQVIQCTPCSALEPSERHYVVRLGETRPKLSVDVAIAHAADLADVLVTQFTLRRQQSVAFSGNMAGYVRSVLDRRIRFVRILGTCSSADRAGNCLE
jgi:hypothetical protein